MRQVFIFVLLLFIPIQILRAESGENQIAVLDLDPIGVTRSESQTLTDRLRSELVATGAFTVIERAEMDEILKEQGFQQTGCTSDACAVEIGKLLNVRRIVAGSIGKIGSVYTISLRVIDVETGVILATYTEDCTCPLEKVLTISMKKIAQKMALGGIASFSSSGNLSGKGDIYIKSQPTAADIFVDGKAMKLQTPATVRNVPAGEHLIKLKKGNYVGSKVVNVIPNDITEVTVSLTRAHGGLKVYSDPPEAEIFIEGKYYGKTPRVIKNLPAGEYLVTLRKAHYLDLRKQVKIEGESYAVVEGKLMKPADLTITSEPPGAQVTIRGKNMGTTPLTLKNLYPERVYVEVEANGYKTERRYITLREAFLNREHFVLKKLPTLSVNSTPSGARVYVNGNFKGMTPLKLGSIDEEHVQVEVKKKFYHPWKKDLTLSAGQNVVLHAQLTLRKGKLIIESTPTGAKLFINGEKAGRTPYQQVLPFGEYQVKLSRSGFVYVNETVVFDQPELLKRFKLEPLRGTVILDNVLPDEKVFIDGKEYSTRQKKFKLRIGTHEIKIQRSGYLTHTEVVVVKANQVISVNGALKPKTRVGAVLRSLVIPGWGQMYQEKSGRAALYPILFLGTAVASYSVGVLDYNKAVEDYHNARENYLAAFTIDEINYTREEMYRAYDEIVKMERMRNALFITAGAIWLWNVMDALFLPPGFKKHVRLSAAPSGAAIGVQLSLSLGSNRLRRFLCGLH